jgi:hypothetical protein
VGWTTTRYGYGEPSRRSQRATFQPKRCCIPLSLTGMVDGSAHVGHLFGSSLSRRPVRGK